jgi:hypothetical protein
MLAAPPSGWNLLQERARRAENPEELATIIDEMNRLLAEYEKSSGDLPGKKPRRQNGRARRRRVSAGQS